MYTVGSIRRVHLELTTRCNASCPQCPRNIDGGQTNPNLPLTELSVTDFRKIFPVSFLQQLDSLMICGNYGDPSLARDLVPICEYVRKSAPDISLEVHSNGGARSAEWWKSLAQWVSFCVFAIDGLEDTNHIYRRNTNWNKIMENVRSFIAAGGRAFWNFIVFEHNEHQVESVIALGKSLGFDKVYIKRTGRFLKNHELQNLIPIRDSVGNVIATLRPPSNPELRNPAAEFIRSTYTEDTYADFLAKTPISCKAARSQGIFVSAEGLVFPCCWMAQIHPTGKMSVRKRQINDLIDSIPGGRTSINALVDTIEMITSREMFQQEIPAGWQTGPSRLRVCAKFCGAQKISDVQRRSINPRG